MPSVAFSEGEGALGEEAGPLGETGKGGGVVDPETSGFISSAMQNCPRASQNGAASG